jgi:hypothetical protein
MCATHKATRVTRIFSLSLQQAQAATCSRKERKNIWRLYVNVCVCVCSALSVYVFVLAFSHKTLHGRRRHIYNVKQKEREGRHSLLLFHIVSFLSIHHHHHSTHTHTQLLLTDSHTVQKTSKQASKQASRQTSKAAYIHCTRLIRHLLFKVCIFKKKRNFKREE